MGTAAANHSNKLTFGSLGASEVGPAAEVGRPLSNSVHLLSAVANSAGKPPPDLKGKYPRREGKALLCSLPRRRARAGSVGSNLRTHMDSCE